MKLSIINGPNLNLLGKREPNIYGKESFDVYLDFLKEKYSKVNFDYFQSNIEGEIIDQIQKVGFSYDGILLNAAAFTHTSIGIADAIKSISTPVIEIHISNTFSREDFRHKSYISPVSKGLIVGFGFESYRLGVESFITNYK
jgi:3-dehydroquinate dehydratase-2|tara:strand:- start:1095 stop:1520 length:426 start_codon:yes stop_codon:yes gene_type:complete